jgi:hypothetical protein
LLKVVLAKVAIKLLTPTLLILPPSTLLILFPTPRLNFEELEDLSIADMSTPELLL